MKSLFTGFIIFFIGISIQAQAPRWVELMQDSDANFFETVRIPEGISVHETSLRDIPSGTYVMRCNGQVARMIVQ